MATPRKHRYTEKRARDLARTLHEKLCRANHTDGYGCSWSYEFHSNRNGAVVEEWNSGSTHLYYLDKAERVLAKYGSRTVRLALAVMDEL